MKDSIASAHRALDGLFEYVEGALNIGDVRAASEAFAQLREALETHVEQEDRLYYPAIRSLRPEFEISLGTFTKEHAAFRDDMAEIQRLLEADSCGETQNTLERFHRAFALHEAAEEAMLESLDRHPRIPAT